MNPEAASPKSSDQPSVHARRQVYMILSPRSLPYSRLCLESLLRSSYQALDLRLITDSAADQVELADVMAELAPDPRHAWTVVAEAEMLDREASLFGPHERLRTFRHGHPCWRKITDPLLLSEPGQELVLLDPDLYFHNTFQFEETPQTGLLLMWQKPNCLLPPEIVRSAMDQKIPLAHHVDIGVGHWREGQDLAWIDWLIGRLGGASLPRAMHIEAIVWAAIAMRDGGGYLNPGAWVCWHRTQVNRIRRKLGASVEILRSEPWQQMKCFHGGGEAKWWLPALEKSASLPAPTRQLAPTPILPFVELTPSHFGREQNAKHLLRSLGYYKLFGSS